MDFLENLKGEIDEQRKFELSEKKKAQAKTEEIVDPYLKAKQANPGREVLCFTGILKCTSRFCRFRMIKSFFLTRQEGILLGFPCPKCDQTIVTLYDTERVFGQNTFPIQDLKNLYDKEPSRLIWFRNIVMESIRFARKTIDNLKDDGRYRESVVHEGKEGNRPIKMKMTMQTAEEAIREMNPVDSPTTKFDPLSEIDREGVAKFLLGSK